MTRRAFTLIDLSISLAIVAIAVVVVIPTASPAERIQLIGSTNTLVADIEFAQSEALANPSDPAIVRFDVVANTYWVARASTPDTPIIHPINNEPYLRTLNDLSAAALSIDLPSGGDTIAFDNFGALIAGEDTVARISSTTDELWIVIGADTGFASITADDPVAAPPPEPDPAPEGGGGVDLGGGGLSK